MKELNEMQELFKMIDKDKDGEISETELGHVIKDLGIQVTHEQLGDFFKQMDKDKSGTISFSEFVSGLRWTRKSAELATKSQQNPLSKFVSSLKDDHLKKMKDLFMEMDKNKDGALSRAELVEVMTNLGVKANKQEFDELFSNLDENGNGTIELEEFVGGLRWLHVGMKFSRKTQQISSESEPEQSIAENHKVLLNYVRDMVSRGMSIAEKNYREKNYEEAKMILDTMDLGTLISLEVFLGGNLTTEKHREHYEKMNRRLSSLKQ